MRLCLPDAVLAAILIVLLSAWPASAKKHRGGGCVTVTATGSNAVTEGKARFDARTAWRAAALSKVNATMVDNMRNDRYLCSKIGSGLARHVNWRCEIKAQACPSAWTP